MGGTDPGDLQGLLSQEARYPRPGERAGATVSTTATFETSYYCLILQSRPSQYLPKVVLNVAATNLQWRDSMADTMGAVKILKSTR